MRGGTFRLAKCQGLVF